MLGEPVGEPVNKSLIDNDNGGPEGVSESLISLAFSWAKINNLPVVFRMVPRLAAVASGALRPQNVSPTITPR
jgi:hypothetical protein